MYKLNARDHFNCSPSFFHETDAAKRKGGGHSRWNDTISCRYALSRLERYFWFLVYFLNNSIKNQPILIILAQNNLKKTDTGKILKCAHFSYKPLSHYLGKCKK